jgi:hypothetical protein
VGDATIGGSISVSEDINGVDITKVLTRSEFSTTKHATQTVSVNANTTVAEQTETFTKAGFYPCGIVGLCVNGANLMYQNVFEWFLSSRSNGSATVTYRFRNNASVAVNISIDIYILWIKVL